MEIAALPSCEKSLFAGAKVTLFFGFRGLRLGSHTRNFAGEPLLPHGYFSLTCFPLTCSIRKSRTAALGPFFRISPAIS